MAIVTDIKNAIRDKIFEIDSSVNFNFDEIQNTVFPYVFFYIPSFRIDKAVDSQNFSRLDLMCVLEYEKQDQTSTVDLWAYADVFSEVLRVIPIYDGSITPRNQEYKLVDKVLQVTFDVTAYFKAEDTAELMEELDLTFKIGEMKNGNNTTNI